ncbi:MAG: Dabb family protein [Candidatus Giovannonibacteria bacterium]|nr:Dabb family protein [Candidatus Giovannonibacteria bacterium]
MIKTSFYDPDGEIPLEIVKIDGEDWVCIECNGKNTGKAALWHIVLISFRQGAPQAARQEIYDRYQTLDEDCGGKEAGILFWKVDWNLDLRKNVHLVERASFESAEALQTFRRHPKHEELTDILSQIADWQVGDVPS